MFEDARIVGLTLARTPRLPVEALSAVLKKIPNMLILVEKLEKTKAIGPTIVLASNTHLSAP
jgi:hypothetical protein